MFPLTLTLTYISDACAARRNTEMTPVGDFRDEKLASVIEPL